MEPEVIAKCTNFTNYAHANKAALTFTDKAVLEDPAVFPSDDIMKPPVDADDRFAAEPNGPARDAWNRIKTGS